MWPRWGPRAPRHKAIEPLEGKGGQRYSDPADVARITVVGVRAREENALTASYITMAPCNERSLPHCSGRKACLCHKIRRGRGVEEQRLR